MKYIDAEKLYKQVDSLMARYAEYEKEFEVDDEELSIFYQGKSKMCGELLCLIDPFPQEQPSPYFYCIYGGTMPLCSDCKRNHNNSSFKTEEITTWYAPSNGTKHCIDYIQQEQTEVDLDEEVHRFFEECIEVHEVPLYGKFKERVIPVDCYELTARHFAEWGEKQKEKEPIAESKRLANKVIEYLTKCGYSPFLKDDSKKEHFRIDIPRHKDDFWLSEEYKHCRSVLGEYYMEGDYGGDTYTLYVWREKKEQKPVDFPTTDEEVKEFLETHPKDVEVPEKYKTPDFVFSKQEYESHPIISQDTTSVKPAEWSEEDIKKIRSEEYTKGFNDAAFVSKLKEWSVEDEDRIRQIERIAQAAGCTQKLQEEIHDWLKSLRPHPKQDWRKDKHNENNYKDK